MRIEYVCKQCGSIFEPFRRSEKYYSVLVEALKNIECPLCVSPDTELTKKSKLLLERKTKINKIEKNN